MRRRDKEIIVGSMTVAVLATPTACVAALTDNERLFWPAMAIIALSVGFALVYSAWDHQ